MDLLVAKNFILISSGGLVYEVEVEFNLDLPGFTDVFDINGLSQIENMNVTEYSQMGQTLVLIH